MRRALVPAVAAALVATCLATSALAERTWALVIGIDTYDSIPNLHGAVNDARDIAAALDDLGAETTLLLDGDASRDAILSTWRDLATQAAPGDRLIVTYAGHGSDEVEAIAGEEEDGRDENWLLAGFSPIGPGMAERIRDNEIAELIALNPAIEVILLSDSCHSGTVSRDVAPILGYRYYRTDGSMADDPLPPPPPRPAGTGDEFSGVALYLGAVPDGEKVPEYAIDDQPRGALSHAFASGLRGGADTTGDGLISAADLERYVRARVRAISWGLQRPQIVTNDPELVFRVAGTAADEAPSTTDTAPDQPASPDPSGPDLPDVTVPDDPDPSSGSNPPDTAPPGTIPPEADAPPTPQTEPVPPAPDPFLTAFADLPPITLSVSGTLTDPPEGARLLPADTPADLVLDTATGILRSPAGDIFAILPPLADPDFATRLQLAVDSARLVGVLLGQGDSGPLAIGFRQGDGNYSATDPITVHVDGRQTRHLAILNLAPDGALRPIFPLARFDDPSETDPSNAIDIGLEVQAPFGADFMIAVETTAPSAAMALLLADPDTTWTARTLWEALQLATFEGAAPAVAAFPFHSIGP